MFKFYISLIFIGIFIVNNLKAFSLLTLEKSPAFATTMRILENQSLLFVRNNNNFFLFAIVKELILISDGLFGKNPPMI